VTVIALTVLLGLMSAVSVALGVIALRRGRGRQAAEDAVVALARSWSEDGSSRGRLCAAAQLVAGGQAAFLAEVTRRGDAIQVTATAGVSELVGVESPLDPATSLLAQVVETGRPLPIPDVGELSEGKRVALTGVGVRSGHMHPVRHHGHVVAVLCVGWSEARHRLTDVQEVLVAELAAEAGRAIERDAHVALLARQARTDELTALPNRRAWDEAVQREMARAQRTQEPLCLALLDLDHFKAYNDLYGHPAGDAHLRRAAALWRREVRAIDVLARYGGEEFGVLLPSCEIIEAHEVIDRVRSATPNGQTASAGVVQYDGRESADSLLARADAALYRAKHMGRATTVHA
jgi:diguanylate cyclase (GGDEF)-like protein